MTSGSLPKIIKQTACGFAAIVAITSVGCHGERAAVSETDMQYLKKFSENRYAVRLKAPLLLRNQAGEVVGRLEAGCVLQSPSIDDVGDVDVSDNQRMKVVFDISDRSQWEAVDGLPILEGAPVSVTPTP